MAALPGAPRNLDAYGDDKKNYLGWSAPSSNGGATITSYRVFRGTTSSNQQVVTSGGCANLGAVLACTDTGLTNGQKYYYIVSAINSSGQGPPSNQVTSTPTGPTIPGAPRNLDAYGDDRKNYLGWSAPSSNGGATITRYRVFRGTTSSNQTLVTSGSCANLSAVLACTDTGLTNGQLYHYFVSAENSVGTGPPSNSVTSTPVGPTVPEAPRNLDAYGDDGKNYLGWSAPSSNGGATITRYRVFRGTTSSNQTLVTSGGCANLSAVLACTDTGLTNGQIYHYFVSAENSVGTGPPSNSVTSIPVGPTVPGAPQNMDGYGDDGKNYLGWNAPASNGGAAIIRYRVFRGTTSSNQTLVTSGGCANLGVVLACTDTGLANGQIYHYFVSAENSVGTGPPSNSITATPVPAGVPEIRIVPTTLTFNVSTGLSSVFLSSATLEAVAGHSERVVDAAAFTALVSKAQRNGAVRVIVKVDAPFVPEGRLDAPFVKRQREVIRNRVEDVLQALDLPASRITRFKTIPFVALEVDAVGLARLLTTPAVRNIQEEVAVPPTLASSNPVIGSGVAWAAGFSGMGQTIAVLDTGVDSTHPYFSSGTNKVVSEACYSSTFTNSTSVCPGGVTESTATGSGRDCLSTISNCRHGTHVAGIAAGNDGVGPNFGVARDANIIAVQVFSRRDATVDCAPAAAPCIKSWPGDQIKGLERVLALSTTFQIAAVNMSLGAGEYTSSAVCDAENLAVKAAIDNLRSVGIATIIASGNNGYRNAMNGPGCISTAVGVGATNDTDDLYSLSNIASFISLLAPGVSITSSVPGGSTATLHGTSMAAPHVAGAWALMLQASPGADVPTILNMLRNTGTVVDDDRADGSVTGMRRINVGDAVSGGGGQTFTIHNDGTVGLSVTSMALQSNGAWISWSPAAPFTVPAGGSQQVLVSVDMSNAPSGQSTRRLLVNSNDSDESPYPDAVDIVVNNSTLPTITISATDGTASEAGTTSGMLTVTRSGATTAALNVSYTVGGSATAGSDYNALAGTVTIPAGSPAAGIEIVPIDDTAIESDEAVIVTLSGSAAYTIGTPGDGTVTIESDDSSITPPLNVVATAAGTSVVNISWTPVGGAASYRVYRSSNHVTYAPVGSPVGPMFSDTTVSGGTAYLYKVRALASNESGDSNIDLATTFVFADATLTQGLTSVKVVHFTELLAAVNAVRLLAGLATIDFAAPVPGTGVMIRLQHLGDLRSALDEARATIGQSVLSYTDPALITGSTRIVAAHVTEIRNAVK